MNPGLAAAFQICLTELPAGHGLRLVVSMIGEEPQPAAGAIRLQELPLEALYSPDTGFLAMDPATPVSRSLKFRPDP